MEKEMVPPNMPQKSFVHYKLVVLKSDFKLQIEIFSLSE